eukprot:TRINITY_DN6051_c0_g1_i10.p1 TRINITY_DN6051_c0_g1~~TRINITY_DN6051_c0_g1_i10.p1  ORF type:complete len:185 (-),score=43.43 TRINITY_DN6051_c0_g1_i10:276-830(-)
MQKMVRLKKEMEKLEVSPPPGAQCWQKGDALDQLEAIIFGPAGSAYQGGAFKLDISVPDRYPFEPPKVEMRTPCYHPNIDDAGRICLDILKMPPAGSWRPSINLYTVLTSVQRLLAEPNPKDPLMVEIASEFELNYDKYFEKAKSMTEKFAMKDKDNKESSSEESKGQKRPASSQLIKDKRIKS